MMTSLDKMVGGATAGWGKDENKTETQMDIREPQQLFQKRMEFLDAALTGAKGLQGEQETYTQITDMLMSTLESTMNTAESPEMQGIYSQLRDYVSGILTGKDVVPAEQKARLNEIADLQLRAGTAALDETFANSVTDAHKALIARGIRGGVMTASGPAVSELNRASAARVAGMANLQSTVRGQNVAGMYGLEGSAPTTAAQLWQVVNDMRSGGSSASPFLQSISALGNPNKSLIQFAGVLPNQSNMSQTGVTYGDNQSFSASISAAAGGGGSGSKGSPGGFGSLMQSTPVGD